MQTLILTPSLNEVNRSPIFLEFDIISMIFLRTEKVGNIFSALSFSVLGSAILISSLHYPLCCMCVLPCTSSVSIEEVLDSFLNAL